MQLKMTRQPNPAGWFRSSLSRTSAVLGGMIVAMAGGLAAQDYDFVIQTDKDAYAPGEALTATVGLTTRAPGAQGLHPAPMCGVLRLELLRGQELCDP